MPLTQTNGTIYSHSIFTKSKKHMAHTQMDIVLITWANRELYVINHDKPEYENETK